MHPEDREIMTDIVIHNVPGMTKEMVDKLTDAELSKLYYNCM